MPTPETKFLTAAEVADRLRCSPFKVTMLCRENKLPATKPLKHWLISETDLAEFLAAQRNDYPEAS